MSKVLKRFKNSRKNKKNTSSDHSLPANASFLRKAWHFIWYENSVWSWLVNIVLAFILIKFVFYPVLSLLLGSSLPVVAVVSESMDHGFVKVPCTNSYVLCSTINNGGVSVSSLDDYWSYCGSWYEKRNISLSNFSGFPFSNGFSKGDIIILRGKNPADIKVGDVIVFQSKKPYPIIHRVVNKSFVNGKYVFQTKGDHNPSQISNYLINELFVPQDVVLGVAVARIPWLGWVKIGAVDLLKGSSSC